MRPLLGVVMTNQAASSRGPVTAELSRQATKLTISAVILVVSIVLFVLPATSIMRGTILGGGNQVTLSVSDAAYDSDVVSVLKKRADNLYERNLSVEAVDENTVVVRVPALYDAQSVAESLVGTGHVEFVSQLDISDADELELLTSSPDSLTLAEGTYSAFMTSDNIVGAKVISSGSGDSAYYYLQISLDQEGTEAFAAETEELASSYGVIAFVVDGSIVSTPYVSEKIESSEITLSGFTRDEAYALAAKLNNDELPLTLTVGQSSSFEDVCGGFAPYVALAALVAIGAVADIAFVAMFGRAGLVGAWSLVATAVVGLGIMSILALFDFVILGTWELGAGISVAVLSLVATGLGAYTYHKARIDGSSVRKSQQLSAASMLFAERIYVAIVVVALIATFFTSNPISEFLWSLAAGLTAEVILAWLFKEPMLCVLTASDALLASSSSDEAQTDQSAQDSVE